MEWWLIVILIVALGVLLCFLLALANFSGERFAEKYDEMNQKFPSNNLNPLDFIYRLNTKYFDNKIQIIQISRKGRDSYSKGKLFLSTFTLQNPTLASFSIIAHEMGHAMQDKNSKKIKTLSRLRRLGKILGYFMLPSILAGVILMILGDKLFIWGILLAVLGVLIFLLALFIKLRTISIEKDASNKALKFLKEFFNEKEVLSCKSFMNDARLTYWADFLRICLGWTAMSKKTKLFN